MGQKPVPAFAAWKDLSKRSLKPGCQSLMLTSSANAKEMLKRNSGERKPCANYLSLKPRPDGVFCFNDPLAMGAMNYALDQGIRIPEDLAVIGCGNLHYDDSLRVPLSSIDQHSRQIGEQAARITLAILHSKVPPKPETVVLQPQLVVRGSTRRRAAKKATARALNRDTSGSTPKKRR